MRWARDGREMNMKYENNTITKNYACDHCGHTEAISFNFDDYARWKNGEYIQFALDYLTPSQREIMLSSGQREMMLSLRRLWLPVLAF